jgi:membrane-bound serine protease (ClpP class)
MSKKEQVIGSKVIGSKVVDSKVVDSKVVDSIKSSAVHRFSVSDARGLGLAILVSCWLLAQGWSECCSFAAICQADGVEFQKKVRPENFRRPGLIEFKGEINLRTSRYFNNRFEQARRDGVDLLIIEIESPGGLKFESLVMANKLSKCDWAYTVALIPQEAISGGALLALGCDEILISPEAKLGNIGEIGFDPEAMAFRLIRPKVESSLAHDARALALAKGRPADLVEAFVDKDILVYQRLGRGGTLEFRQARVDDREKPEAPWELIEETKPERFMTLSGKRAVELQLANGLATSREDFARLFRIESLPFRYYRYSSNDTVVHLLNNPLITVLIIAIGLIALYVEFSSPGLGAGGLIAGLCMLLFFWSRYLGGTAGWLEILLFAAGMTFLMLEIFVIPGFGVSGGLGIVLLFCSVLLASQNFTVPATADEWNQSISSMMVLLGSVLIFFVAATFISRHFGSLPVFNRLVLEPPQLNPGSSDMGDKPKPGPVTHPPISVGDWGKAESLLRPAGRAVFAGRGFDVISDGSFIEPGTQVKVIRINGNVITVAKVDA